MDLFAQGIERDAQRVTDKIIDVLAVKLELPVVSWKQRFRETIEDVCQCVPDGARRATPSRRMLWVSSREARNSATIRSSCQRGREMPSGLAVTVRDPARFRASCLPCVSATRLPPSSRMRQRNAHFGEEIPIRVVIDFDILAIPVDQARQSM